MQFVSLIFNVFSFFSFQLDAKFHKLVCRDSNAQNLTFQILDLENEERKGFVLINQLLNELVLSVFTIDWLNEKAYVFNFQGHERELDYYSCYIVDLNLNQSRKIRFYCPNNEIPDLSLLLVCFKLTKFNIKCFDLYFKSSFSIKL